MVLYQIKRLSLDKVKIILLKLRILVMMALHVWFFLKNISLKLQVLQSIKDDEGDIFYNDMSKRPMKHLLRTVLYIPITYCMIRKNIQMLPFP